MGVMDDSILDSTKKVVGIHPSDTSFDQDVITQINTAFFQMHQLGVGQPEGFGIEDNSATWNDFMVPLPDLQAVRTYVMLKVQMFFDPPQIGFLVEAKKQQLEELEVRLNINRENRLYEEANP